MTNEQWDQLEELDDAAPEPGEFEEVEQTQKRLSRAQTTREVVAEVLAALEQATGKLELILARDPGLALAPVDLEVVTYDLLANPDTVKAMIHDAENYLEDGEIQKARPFVANLASEIQFRTTSIPLATYPSAIKAVTPLIDEGKLDEAKDALQSALNTLVVSTDEVVPLPKLRAEQMLKNAEALAEELEGQFDVVTQNAADNSGVEVVVNNTVVAKLNGLTTATPLNITAQLAT